MLTAELPEPKRKRKRTGKDTGSLDGNQNAHEGEVPGAIRIISDAGHNISKHGDRGGLSSVASVLSKYVVSLASFNGGTMLFGCAGILIETSCPDTTSILTSASLLRSDDDENTVIDNITIKVRLLDDLVLGRVHDYDLNYDLAVVKIEKLHGFHAPSINSKFQVCVGPSDKVVAVGRCFNSGMLITTREVKIGELSNEICEHMHAKCNLDTAWIGGPLVGSERRLVGINCRGGKNAFVPRSRIVEFLQSSGINSTDVFNQGVGWTTKEVTNNFEYFRNAARKNGYPFPNTFRCDYSVMHVLNSFEEEFGGDIWSKLSEEVSSTLSECVVALASFNGDERHFACTGVFIECYPARILTSASLIRNSCDRSNICDNLRIEVCLKNKRCATATLKHYDLRYNVAVFEISGFRSLCAIELEEDVPFSPNIDVVAVGCRFKGFKLMATEGVLVDEPCKLDCKELGTSTCNITKAGIGGPLIDMFGNFVGMNFFHEKETPYVPRKIIKELVKEFNSIWCNAAMTLIEGDPYRWPVPEPYWSYPPSTETDVTRC